MIKTKKPELLAPAGNIDALKAAVNAGADAVYFGCSNFSARAFAGNFEGELLEEAFKYCRAFGVKTNITLNTLLSDSELVKVLKLVDELENKYKPDAYIVQDMGLIKVLKSAYPDIPIHASTQMQIHSSLAAQTLKNMGVSRIVFARELSKDDIKSATECGLETEIFIHGAICVCASGGCLMSSAIGGRSGNRGECAQPCRQMYSGGYPLSLKDMCLADYIPEICEMGVDCLKIEGRMKSPEYVYEVTRIYRNLIDDKRKPTAQEKERLSNIFSRSGFTDGYYTGKRGVNMFGIRTENDKEISRSIHVDITPRKIDATINCSIKKGSPSYINATVGNVSVSASGNIPDYAHSRPLTVDDVKARLEKSGGTIFKVNAKVDIDDGLIMSVSSINALRRNALSALENEIINQNAPDRSTESLGMPRLETKKALNVNRIVGRFEGKIPSEKVLKAAFEICDRIDLPIWKDIPEWVDTSRVSLILPRIIYDSEVESIKLLIENAFKSGVKDLTVPNISFLPLCKGFNAHGDYTLNLTNSYTAAALKELGFADVCVSPEQRASSIKTDLQLSYMVYGKMPLMHTDNCIIQNCGKCKNTDVCSSVLQDKTGACFSVIREYKHRNTIYNSVPTYLIDKSDVLEGITSVLMFTDESDEEILNILNGFRIKSAPCGAFTRAAYKKKGGVFNE